MQRESTWLDRRATTALPIIGDSAVERRELIKERIGRLKIYSNFLSVINLLSLFDSLVGSKEAHKFSVFNYFILKASGHRNNNDS